MKKRISKKEFQKIVDKVTQELKDTMQHHEYMTVEKITKIVEILLIEEFYCVTFLNSNKITFIFENEQKFVVTIENA